MQLDDSLIGQRLTVRYRRTDPDGGPSMSDVVGVLRHLDNKSAWLERRNGEIAQVDISAVLIVKIVPRHPTRRRRARNVPAEILQEVIARSWPALTRVQCGQWPVQVVGDVDLATMNTAVAIGEPDDAIEDTLTEIESFFHGYSVVPLVRVVAESKNHELIKSAGWRPHQSSSTLYVRDLTDPAQVPAHTQALASGVSPPSAAWLESFIPGAPGSSHAHLLLEQDNTQYFARDASTGCVVRTTVVGEWAVIDLPHNRVRDPDLEEAAAAVSAGLTWAVSAGADKALLIIDPGQDAHTELAGLLGFNKHHTFWYLRPSAR